MNDDTFGHFINMLNYVSRSAILVQCKGVTDYLMYSFERNEWRVYNETFRVEDISEIVFRSSGVVYIELEAE